jgi:arylsulfatase A-like enzyme
MVSAGYIIVVALPLFFALFATSMELSRVHKIPYYKLTRETGKYISRVGLLYTLPGVLCTLFFIPFLLAPGYITLLCGLLPTAAIAAYLAKVDLEIDFSSSIKSTLIAGYETLRATENQSNSGHATNQETDESGGYRDNDGWLYRIGVLAWKRGTDVLVFLAAVIAMIPFGFFLYTDTSAGIVLWLCVAPIAGTAVPVHQSEENKESDTDSSSDQKNVIVYFIDDLRRDRVSMNGHKRPTTPNIDRLSRESVVFENCIAPGMRSPHSIPSMLSGAPASVHEAGANQNCKTLAEELSEHGYTTAAISGNPHITERYYGDRFDWFYWKRRGRGYQYVAQRLLTRAFGALGKKHIPANYFLADADYFADLSIEFLKNQSTSDEPYLLYVHQMELHTPFVRELSHLEEFASQTEFDLDDNSWQKRFDLNIHRDHWYTDEVQNFGYDEIVRNSDRNLGRIIDHLRSENELEETTIVVASDHGELLGERGLWGHLDIPYNTLFEVPLLIRDPDVENKRVEQVVSGSQLPSLVLDCLDISPSSAFARQWHHQKGISELDEGETPPALIDIYAGKSGYNEYDPTKLLDIDIEEISSQRMLVGESWKMHELNGRYYYYRYEDDFLNTPLGPEEVPEDVQSRYQSVMQEVKELTEEMDAESESKEELNKAVRNQLDDLGYV